jgi:pimeloyl-ACP methyl ester carboxylesterase
VDGAIFAEVYGSDTPDILALHGWGRRGSDFARCLDGLSALAPDLPGFGASPAPHQAIGADVYADVIAGLLDVFERPPVLVGHSFGGRVAVCLAAKHPDKVGSLVLTGAPLIRLSIARRPALAYRIGRWLHRVGVIGDERMERMRRNRGSADYRASTGVMRDILVKVVNESYEGQLRRISAPVHLLWGAEDAEVPVSVAEASVALLSNATLEILPGVGHMVPLEAPDALRSAVAKALG